MRAKVVKLICIIIQLLCLISLNSGLKLYPGTFILLNSMVIRVSKITNNMSKFIPNCNFQINPSNLWQCLNKLNESLQKRPTHQQINSVILCCGTGFMLDKLRKSNFLIIFVFRIHLCLWMVLDWFWIGFGSEAILIYQSLNIHLFALYMPYIYKGIWHIFWK